MLGFDFKSRLKRLNPLLYGLDGPVVSSVMLRRPRRDERKSDYNYLQADAAKYLEAMESGHVDEVVCGYSREYVPEWDVFELATGRVLARGWRSILKLLVERRLVTRDRARKVFNCPSLMEADFDNLTVAEKVQRARDIEGWEPPKDSWTQYKD